MELRDLQSSAKMRYGAAHGFIVVSAVVLAGYTLASTSVLRARPALALPLRILACIVLLCLYRTVAARREAPVNASTHTPLCAFCGTPKLPRMHHCKQCATCTARMSHHCAVLGVCIGAHNYKYFMLLLLYGAVATCTAVMLCFPYALQYLSLVLYSAQPKRYLLLWLYTFHIETSVALGLIALFVAHLYLISINKTCIEIRGTLTLSSMFPLTARGWRFNLGLFDNFRDACGPLWCMLFPFTPRREQFSASYTRLVDSHFVENGTPTEV